MQHISQLGSDCSKHLSTAARGGAACAAMCAAISQISLPPTLLVRLQDPALIKEKTQVYLGCQKSPLNASWSAL